MKAEKMMNRRSLGGAALCIAASAVLSLPLSALAADEAPDALIKRLSADVLNTVKSDKAIPVSYTHLTLPTIYSV